MMKNFDYKTAQSAQVKNETWSTCVIGLGVMGGNLALNLAENGFPTVVFDANPQSATELVARSGVLNSKIMPASSLQSLASLMQAPRVIILMLPAGSAIDKVIEDLTPHLSTTDVIIDAGNSNYEDTNRRARSLAETGPDFLGAGMSGGEKGARHGPAIMAGGTQTAWAKAAPYLENISAHYGVAPCAGYVGDAGAGHLVKTVHNGIEYGDMQMIAEVYGIMRDGMGQTPQDMNAHMKQWLHGRLRSYLLEITESILASRDPKTNSHILDIIVDSAGQKGTGRWTAVEAIRLGAPAGTVQAALDARVISSKLETRERGSEIFGARITRTAADTLNMVELEKALIAGKIISYTQGFEIIREAAVKNNWKIDLGNVARLWRGGCIIRSAMLDDIALAFDIAPDGNLMHFETFSEELRQTIPALRKVVSASALSGLPVPALANALSYFEMSRMPRSTANMIQAQRDYFGAHGFQRRDTPGAVCHGPWA